MRTYSEGIVGERSYQRAIGRCHVGQAASIEPEPDNPYDARALRVVAGGATIGYISRESWIQRAVHKQGKTPLACIQSIAKSGPYFGVVLAVAFGGMPVVVPKPMSRSVKRRPRRGLAGTLLRQVLKGLFR